MKRILIALFVSLLFSMPCVNSHAEWMGAGLFNEDGELLIDGSGGTFPVSGTITAASGITTVADGRKVVAVAGTRETLAASTTIKKVDITALQANTGVIVVGGATVVASAATRTGVPLQSLDTITVYTDNLADIYLDSTVSGEGASFTYYV